MTATPSNRPASSDPSDSEGAASSSTSTGGAFVVPSADDTALRALRNRVYSRSGAESPTAEADRRRLARIENAISVPVAVAVEPREKLAQEPPLPDMTGPARRRPPVAAVLLGVFAVAITSTAVAHFIDDERPTGALDVFAKEVTPADSLPRSARFIKVDNSEIAQSRILGRWYGWDVWATLTDDQRICLFAGREGETVVDCVSPPDFRRDGVELTLPKAYADNIAMSTKSIGLPVALSWGPDDPRVKSVDVTQ